MMKSPGVLNADAATPYCAIMTDDVETILNFAAESAESDFGGALITLVDIRGGASRALGAQMAVRGDGGYCGYVSGGCTEAAVAAEALQAIARGIDRYLLLGEGSRFFDIVLPCGGGITLAIHVLKDPDPLRAALAALRSRRRIAIGYDPESQSITVVGHPSVTGWDYGSFVRGYKPKARLILCGRGIELDATARLATVSEFETLSFDGRTTAKIDDDDIDQDTAIALLFHDIDQEIPFLHAALKGKPFYLGALGSRRTHERRCQGLLTLGYAKDQIDRIKAPIGMFGPVRDAGSLALSVLADVVAARSPQAS